MVGRDVIKLLSEVGYDILQFGLNVGHLTVLGIPEVKIVRFFRESNVLVKEGFESDGAGL